MDVLYVTGACLTRNTSANMSHNAFVQGLLENRCNVDILMAKDSWGNPDQGLPVWEEARYFVYPSLSAADKLRLLLKKTEAVHYNSATEENVHSKNQTESKEKVKDKIRKIGKAAFYTMNRPDPVYPLEKQWLKNAAKFSSDKHYDLVISNSSPAASHRLVVELIKNRHILFDRWIQIWEDPWFHDLYGQYSHQIEEEEHSLLRQASEIFYVSPLTLMYQKKYYPDCADKMNCIPLPALQFSDDIETNRSDELSFGYYGDYYTEARDLRPFYTAINEKGHRCYIYGDSNLSLKTTDKIEVSGRVTLDKLKKVQDKTDVLVHLSNLRGGQIPGKIYHYSITRKPILFILDGTKEEREELVSFFGAYGRYYFCDNKKESINIAIEQIVRERKSFSEVKSFLPKEVVKRLLF